MRRRRVVILGARFGGIPAAQVAGQQARCVARNKARVRVALDGIVGSLFERDLAELEW